MTDHECGCATFGPGPHDADLRHPNPRACEHAEMPDDDVLNGAYRERNLLVRALIQVGGYAARWTAAPDAFGWMIVYIDTPQGQLSWHFGPGDLDLFEDLPWVEAVAWDGHDTAQKYERLAALDSIVDPSL